MKNTFAFFVLIFCQFKLLAQNKIYDIEIQSLDSNTISLKEYANKKIFIVTASPKYLEKSGIRFLDSLQQVYPGLRIVVVPSDDDQEGNKESLNAIRNNNTKRSIYAASSAVSKKSQRQNSLMKFLTHVNENTHFNNDVNSEFQIFLISESGILYAVVEKGISMKDLDELLNQPDVKQ